MVALPKETHSDRRYIGNKEARGCPPKCRTVNVSRSYVEWPSRGPSSYDLKEEERKTSVVD